jgi:ubiquinol-cytochrome c reductase cytochrome b subunit
LSQLGGGAPLRHLRGFFYPVKEKPEIQAALDEIAAAEHGEQVEASDAPKQLTD